MSEQIREQVSAFLDGELPDTETELLLKRLTRDGELRESFGRYALIGEALRGSTADVLTKGFAGRVNLAIDGEPAQTSVPAPQTHAPRWWRPLVGVSVAASVATIAIVALQQRSLSPAQPATAAVNAQKLNAGGGQSGLVAQNREALSYTVPAASAVAPMAVAPARLTNYVFAHSKYSSGLAQRGVLADLLIEDEEAPAPRRENAPPPAPANPDARVAP
jgi:sigma-E factor negative regulatory protein RseA